MISILLLRRPVLTPAPVRKRAGPGAAQLPIGTKEHQLLADRKVFFGAEASLSMPQGVPDPLGNLWAGPRQHAVLEGGLSSGILPYRHPLNTIPFRFDSPETDR
jgi:hypothetical protein